MKEGFTVVGDDILLGGVKVATFDDGLWPTARQDAEEMISLLTTIVCKEDMKDAVGEAYTLGYTEACRHIGEDAIERESSGSNRNFADLAVREILGRY